MMLLRPSVREGAEYFVTTTSEGHHYTIGQLLSLVWREQHHLDMHSTKALQQSYIIVDRKAMRNLEQLRQVSRVLKLRRKSSCKIPLEISTICISILSLLLTLQVTAAEAASAGCSSQKCGNVTVSYPFGFIGAGCGLPGFQLNCSSSPSYDILTLSTVSGSYQVTALDASYLLLNATSLTAWTYSSVNISFRVAKTSPYLIDTSNVLFGYGANTTARFFTDQDGGTHPSCQNLAVNQYSTKYCDYYACCEASNVPPGVRTVNVSASEVAGSTAIGYASIIFPETYSTSTAEHFGAGSWGMKLGWYLPGNCSADQNSTCSENTTCSETSGVGFRCGCLQGWQGDGYRNGTGCIDVNECNNATLNTCSSTYAICTNTVGNYTCSCPAGFTGNGYAVGTRTNATGCTDIDECASPSLNSCASDATCTNTAGAYKCSCNAGFNGDGFKNGSGCSASNPYTPTPATNNNVAIIAGVAGTSFVTIAVGILVTICCQQKRRKVRRFARRNMEALGNMKDFFSTFSHGKTATLYSLRELEKATKNFADERILGEGGFGTVYKGTLDSGVQVAIKKTNHVDTSGSQQFVNEVSVLSQVNHRNLVRLHGCCLETEVPMLVYEYVPNGNLLEHLQGQRSELHLGWDKRLQIAIETAEALGYLHSAAFPPIYHRDVKTSNILLDDNYVVKVSDFGISRLVKPDATHVSTAVQGTPGYLDPEYFHSYQLTEKSDVYSFGVVLLELITSLKPLDFERDTKDINLTAMVLPYVRMGNVEAIIDPKLVDKDKSNFTQLLQEIQGVAELALRCLAHQRHDRPSMKEVVSELLAIKGVPQRFGGWSDIDSYEPGEVEMLPILDGINTNSTAYTSSSCTSSNDPLVLSRNIKSMAHDVKAR